MDIRPLTELQDFHRCLDLQKESFGWADVDILPARFFVVLRYVGGLVLGAFEEQRLVGFINAMPGIRKGRPYWHSHMLAVAPDYWNSGVGTQLKLAQREHGIRAGIDLIEWTYDPLESKNAYLNIEKLGVIVRRYYVNHYGQTTGKLQKGLDSDRVIAEWWLKRPRTSIGPTTEVRRVAIPSDLQELKKRNLDEAVATQLRVRQAFLTNAADDFFVAGFERHGETGEYVFVKGASSVD